MSLNYDLTKIDKANDDFIWLSGAELYGNTAKLPIGIKADTKYLNPKVESIIFATMIVDMGEVTDSNKVEFYLRYLLWQRLHNYEPFFSFNDLEKVVGLTTNVFTKSNAVFKNDLWKRITKKLTDNIKEGRYNELD